MNPLEPVIGFPFILLPAKAVSQLDVECLAVECLESLHVLVMNIGEFRKYLGLLFRPSYVSGGNPLSKVSSGLGCNLVAICGAADLKAVKPCRARGKRRYPGTI